MNAIARLLERAKAVDDWPPGLPVVREVGGLEPLHGRVAFVEEGWIYWAAEDGSNHASMPDALRRMG